MKEDFLLSLTNEIRDEVMERYVRERRLMELQIEGLQEQAEEVRKFVRGPARRLTRLFFWMITPEIRDKLFHLLSCPEDSPWRQHLGKGFAYELYSVQAGALRDRIRLRKILIRAYLKAYDWNKRYATRYRDLQAECEAVNLNIKNFQRNFDVLAVLSFLRGLDVGAAESSYVLGGNFSADEVTSVEERLRFQPVAIDDLHVMAPLTLPLPEQVQPRLEELADEIFALHSEEVKRLIKERKASGF